MRFNSWHLFLTVANFEKTQMEIRSLIRNDRIKTSAALNAAKKQIEQTMIINALDPKKAR
jgi:hypothetical protein